MVLLTEKIRAEALLPGQLELPVVIGTVSQIEVDQSLIGDAFCVGQRLEVVDGAAVDVDGDLLFQPVRVWIFSWIQFADVIFISHTITSNSIKINALLKVYECFGSCISKISVLCVVKNNCVSAPKSSIITDKSAFSISLCINENFSSQ